MKRSSILVGIVALCGILGILLFVITRRASEPLMYRGKPIEFWVAQLPVTPVPPPGVDLGNVRGFVKAMGQQYGSTNLSDDGSLDAIAAFGTNALPFLLAKLQGLDSVVKTEITKAATKAGVGYLPFRSADLGRLQAVTGLIHLKTLTPETGRTLAALRTNSNPSVASAAAYVLTRRAVLGDSPRLNPNAKAEQVGAANGSQPVGSATNQALPAAGSRR